MEQRSRKCVSDHGADKCRSKPKTALRRFKDLAPAFAPRSCRSAHSRQENGLGQAVPQLPHRRVALVFESFTAATRIGHPCADLNPLWTPSPP